MDLVLRNARLVLADDVVTGSVAVAAGRIADVASNGSALASGIDLDGDYLLPGFIELHTDNFERHLMPRPKVRWPEMPALLAHDAECAAAGITTVYDALGVGDADPEAMRGQDMAPIIAALHAARAGGLLRADHLLHIRCELPAPNALSLFEPFQRDPLVRLISLMDHTPGQRQWTNIDVARVYYTGKKGWSEEKFQRSVEQSIAMQQAHALPHRRWFCEYSQQHGIPLASHDDTLAEHVRAAHAEGVRISEFPTTLDAAREAKALGMSTVMGAPNVIRGGSHSGNVAAVDLAKLGLLDTLSSDYVPASLMGAAFQLTRDAGFTLPRAVATVTRNPAQALALTDRGEVAPGKRADLVQVRVVNDQPVVRAVWREGVRVI
ncbi:MAG: alpha-D-ribose 1-methylphosphonate 5-triphosphate diphosphatase [Betaproteobacteria bacterium]|nr:alpha-D-ribose 1-methylphosphonate 5-triphosphate diphosphatase [Betaproteobacteria bacterium]